MNRIALTYIFEKKSEAVKAVEKYKALSFEGITAINKLLDDIPYLTQESLATLIGRVKTYYDTPKPWSKIQLEKIDMYIRATRALITAYHNDLIMIKWKEYECIRDLCLLCTTLRKSKFEELKKKKINNDAMNEFITQYYKQDAATNTEAKASKRARTDSSDGPFDTTA
ncbi:MAG: hypothetical protein KGJ07_08785 [Patescibacteria group bacterium]|nr:hypothetical protein [Patescibacteria group bacterium]